MNTTINLNLEQLQLLKWILERTKFEDLSIKTNIEVSELFKLLS